MHITRVTVRLLLPIELLREHGIHEIYRSLTMVYQYIYTILYIIHRHVFYLKHTMDKVLTSQETHYVSLQALQVHAINRSVTVLY
jgi:hypothetical protein